MAQSQSDSTEGIAHDETDAVSAVEEAVALIKSICDGDAKALTNEQLAEVRNSLSDLEDIVEKTRKETVEEEMENRLDDGESFDRVSQIQKTMRSVKDNHKAIDVLQEADIDPMRAMEVNASDFAEIANEYGLNKDPISEYQITYFQRR